MYLRLLETRRAQGFTVAQIAFSGSATIAESSIIWPRLGSAWVRPWQEADRYITLANEHGLLVAMALGFHKRLDRFSQGELETMWRYAIARWGAYAVTWLVVGEYNLDNNPARTAKALALGRFIKRTDPFHRAMTIHPWTFAQESHQAWGEPWLDFIMTQGGHGPLIPLAAYAALDTARPPRPFVEGEARYEGIQGKSARDVRAAAYRAMQSGAAGYSYGAHGLWYPTQSGDDHRFYEYGPSRPWWEALAMPGSEEMGFLRHFYESLDWSSLEPRPGAAGTSDDAPVVLARSNQRFVVYFQTTHGENATLRGCLPDGRYHGYWFDPRIGTWRPYRGLLQADATGALVLPKRPTTDDWLFVLDTEGLAVHVQHR
jgi:hypothetical protein